MRAHPSIAFNSLSGTAKEVTARQTKNGTVLSARAKHSHVATPAQKQERAILAKVGRRYKTLTDEQVQLWRQFASRFHGTNNQDYKITACNAFIRHNCNRALIGLEPITEPPASVISVPDVTFTGLLVTPSLIQFNGITYPGSNFRLAIGMSKAVSSGVSYGVGKAVIVDPNFIPDNGVADITRIYTDRLGISPVVGKKYFVTVYWIELNTGFTGRRISIDRIATPDII